MKNYEKVLFYIKNIEELKKSKELKRNNLHI